MPTAKETSNYRLKVTCTSLATNLAQHSIVTCRLSLMWGFGISRAFDATRAPISEYPKYPNW
jgi:hypothetical protein